jgi:hypothetical protein
MPPASPTIVRIVSKPEHMDPVLGLVWFGLVWYGLDQIYLVNVRSDRGLAERFSTNELDISTRLDRPLVVLKPVRSGPTPH